MHFGGEETNIDQYRLKGNNNTVIGVLDDEMGTVIKTEQSDDWLDAEDEATNTAASNRLGLKRRAEAIELSDSDIFDDNDNNIDLTDSNDYNKRTRWSPLSASFDEAGDETQQPTRRIHNETCGFNQQEKSDRKFNALFNELLKTTTQPPPPPDNIYVALRTLGSMLMEIRKDQTKIMKLLEKDKKQPLPEPTKNIPIVSLNGGRSGGKGGGNISGNAISVLPIDNDASDTAEEKSWPTEVMFKGKNLLDTNATTMQKYATTLMSVLFSPEELATGLIKLDNSKSTRNELDPERVKLLKKCVLIKTRCRKDEREKVWKEAMVVANRKCYDTTKKFERIENQTKQ